MREKIEKLISKAKQLRHFVLDNEFTSPDADVIQQLNDAIESVEKSLPTQSPSLVSEEMDKIKSWFFNTELIKTENNGDLFRADNTMRLINKYEELLSTLPVKEGEKDSEDWISVDERLPETDKYYFVWVKEVKYLDGVCLKGKFTINGEWEVFFRDETVISNYVTHWMPLPNPPKHKADEK